MVSPSRLCDLHTPALKACWPSTKHNFNCSKGWFKVAWANHIIEPTVYWALHCESWLSLFLHLRFLEEFQHAKSAHWRFLQQFWRSIHECLCHTKDALPDSLPKTFPFAWPICKALLYAVWFEAPIFQIAKKPQVAKKTRNFKNISATLSCRHQVSLMHALAQSVQTMPTKGGTKTDSLPQINAEWYQELCTAGIHVQCFSWATLSARPIWTSGVQPLIV